MAKETTTETKLKITMEITVEPGVTAQQVKDVLEDGDCGDFDGLVVSIEKLKVRAAAEAE